MIRALCTVGVLLALALALGAEAGAAVPRVETMVVGRSTVLADAIKVRAAAGGARVGGRSCAFAAGTPLAALVALSRAGGPAIGLRDYGSCSSRGRDGAALFVRRIGPDANRGSDGWVYKVGRRVGTTGAADPSGPRGDGRPLRSGQRLLWFWCRMGKGGCQRTLAVRISGGPVMPGSPVPVTVTSYDDQGRGRPAVGATVTLGPSRVSTGHDGRATILAPPLPGALAINATRAGLVPAFPEPLAVR